MMGENSGNQNRLFYSFNLEEHVPKNHLLRGIDQFLDLSDLRAYLAPFYSHTGRPSVDPELMIRMLIVGYCFGIRSERRLCEEVHLNLAYRCFCRLGLEDLLAEPARLPSFFRVGDAQHDDVAVSDLVSNFIFCDESAPDLPPPETRKPLAEAGLGRNTFNAVENCRHGTARGGRIPPSAPAGNSAMQRSALLATMGTAAGLHRQNAPRVRGTTGDWRHAHAT
jgi:transposase